jgi:hypothetical protein
LCDGWTAQAHLVVPLVTGVGTVMLEMAKARGNFAHANRALTRNGTLSSPAR